MLRCHSYTVCVWVRCSVTNTDKYKSRKQCLSPPPLLAGPAWHEELRGSHVTRHTLTSVIRSAAIQFRADQCLQHKRSPRPSWKRANRSNAGVDNPGDSHQRQHLRESCSSGDEPLTMDLIPCSQNGHFERHGLSRRICTSKSSYKG